MEAAAKEDEKLNARKLQRRNCNNEQQETAAPTKEAPAEKQKTRKKKTHNQLK